MSAAEDAGAKAAIVVVDRGGHIVASARMDGVSFVMTDVARRNATMSSAMGLSTADVAEMASGDVSMLHAFTGNEDVLALSGAVPIMGPDGPIGGLGVAGGHHIDDQTIADSAAERF